MTGLVEKKNRSGTRYFENEDGEIAAKECKGCGEVKIMGDFSKGKKSLGRRQSKCKSCERKYREENSASIAGRKRKYHEENSASISKKRRKYYEENRASIAERGRKYHEENRASVLERKRKYREENRDSISDYQRKYKEENRASLADKQRKYQEENRASIAEKSRNYREENRDSVLERKRKYREENRDTVVKSQRKHYEENRASVLEKHRKYYKENRASILERNRSYREENRDSVLERKRKYQEENRTSIAEYKRKHYEENPHVESIRRQRRRARKSALPDTLTKEQLEEITDRFHGGCALTGCTEGTHLDHVIPVVIGHGGTTLQNMIPLRADLNSSKNARCIFDWFYDVKDRFKLSQTKFDELIEYLAHINGMTANKYEDYVRWCHDNQR